ncbi:MAG TPA: efflux RND transporter periplasmic adaptor subunit [bacterium]|jgi:HlyD family secretion protein|nr:efflux RND transporter periplasmic adaptor subunit [bacterium]
MRRWWVLALIVLLAGGGVYAAARIRSRGQGEAPRWRTATVTRGNLEVTVSASGSIQPAAQVEVRSRATGVVRAVLVAEGERVTEGQVLVQIDDPDAAAAVRNAQAALAGAAARLRRVEAQRRALTAQDTAQVRQAQASLEAARARLAQLLAGPRPEEVAQAEAAVRAAEANLALAQRNHQRNEQLFRDGFISQQQVDQSKAELDQAAANHRSALEHLQLVKAGATSEEIAEVRAAVRQQEAALAQAQAGRLEDPVRRQEIAAARAEVAQAASNLANAEARLAETRIRAPIAGIVVVRSVEVGQSVIGSASGGTAVLTLAVDRPLLANVMVDEADIAQIRAGLAAEVSTEGLAGETFTGRVRAISPTAQTVNNVVQYEVTVEVTDPGRRLRFGMTVEAEFILLRREGVLLIPREALRGGQATAVLIANGERLTPRLVRVGGTDGRMMEVLDGLREGEVVYLGEARRGQEAPSQQPRNPFAPQFQRRPTPTRPQGPPGPPP